MLKIKSVVSFVAFDEVFEALEAIGWLAVEQWFFVRVVDDDFRHVYLEVKKRRGKVLFSVCSFDYIFCWRGMSVCCDDLK
jgi:hypothetical protein